ncbi:Macrophage-expressed protein 1 protein, partial [Bulinus truncatus]
LVTFQSDWPVGDPKRCLDYSRSVKQIVQTFEVLPGRGWDNLRNVEAGLMTNYNFTHCTMTDDGNYLLPDNIMTIPIKNSQVQTFAELIKQWSDSKSVTSDSVNTDVGVNLPFMSISGKFSYEHEQMKSTQMEHDAMTTRVQLRYHRYEVKVRTDPELSPEFKGRLLVIGSELAMNQTDHARYLSQLLIRYFGTHILTSLTAGAGLVKDDYFERNFYESTKSDTSSILVSASASFFGMVHVDASYTRHTATANTEGYDNSVRQSFIYTLGGPKFKTNMKVGDWADLVDSNLVAKDKSGDPLYFFINQHTLPELSANIVEEIEQLVQESIENYYEFNTVRGCTKLGLPNFSYAANFEDGTCKDVPTPVKFGDACHLNGAVKIFLIKSSQATGNPMAMDLLQKPFLNWTASSGIMLNSYMAQAGQEAYPRKCPDGFSQQLLNSIGGCSLHYCVRTGSMKSPDITPIRRPPFMKKPTTVTIDKESIPIYNVETKSWMKVSEAQKNFVSSKTSAELPTTTIAGIVTGVVIGCFGLAVMLVIIVKKNKVRRTGVYRRLTEETNDSRVHYGSDMT